MTQGRKWESGKVGKWALALLLTHWLTGSLTHSANWYVDNAASGANNGTSWANAWQSLNTVVAASVAAGDTIFISGGSAGKTYNENWTYNDGGASNNPIVISPGREAGHDGLVTVRGKLEFGNPWLTLEGAKDLGWSTNGVVVTNLWKITNNIGIMVINASNHCIKMAASTGQVVRFVATRDAGTNSGTALHGIVHAYSGAGGQTVRYCEIAYCDIQDGRHDGINFTSNTPDGFAGLKIHHCWVQNHGDDGIQASGGVDIWQCVVKDKHPVWSEGHADTIQLADAWSRVWHVLGGYVNNSGIYLELRPYAVGEIYIYGNLFVDTDGFNPPYALIVGQQWFSGDATNATYTNIVFANNSVAWSAQQGIQNWSSASVLSTTNRATWVLNNCVYYCNVTAGAAGAGIDAGGARLWMDKQEDYLVDWNVVFGNSTKFVYGTNTTQTTYNDAASFNSSTIFNYNSNTEPIFVATNVTDMRAFHPATNDTALVSKGTNLFNYLPASVVTNMPDAGYDMDGQSRGTGGTWTIGAFGIASEPLAMGNNLRNRFGVGRGRTR